MISHATTQRRRGAVSTQLLSEVRPGANRGSNRVATHTTQAFFSCAAGTECIKANIFLLDRMTLAEIRKSSDPTIIASIIVFVSYS